MKTKILLALVLGTAVATWAAPQGPSLIAALPRMETAKSGTYESGPWKYIYTIGAPGTRSERRFGELMFQGKPVAELVKAQKMDRIRTPWGLMQYFGPDMPRFGDGGWLTQRTYNQPLELKQGRLLEPPAAQPEAGAAPPLELAEKDDGRTFAAIVGQEIHIRLGGNPTTGFSWYLARVDGNAVEQAGKIEYQQRPAPQGMVGVGGMFLAPFRAARPGKATVRLEYKRIWEKNPPAKTFSATFEVRPAAGKPAEGAQGVTGIVRKLTGNHMPTVGGPPSGKTQPLSVPVHVFKGAIKPFAKPDPKHPALVKTVRSDAQGRYRVALEGGQYTVVAEINGRLYLNIMQGDGAWATVTVEKDKWAAWNIDDTSEAAF